MELVVWGKGGVKNKESSYLDGYWAWQIWEGGYEMNRWSMYLSSNMDVRSRWGDTNRHPDRSMVRRTMYNVRELHSLHSVFSGFLFLEQTFVLYHCFVLPLVPLFKFCIHTSKLNKYISLVPPPTSLILLLCLHPQQSAVLQQRHKELKREVQKCLE